MGPSGAGKSTLLYSLSGMDKPTLGNIYYDDLDITKLDQNGLALFRRDNAGFVFQSVYLIDSMSVLDNVLVSGLLVNKNKKEVTERAKELLKKVDITLSTYFSVTVLEFPVLYGSEYNEISDVFNSFATLYAFLL